MLIHAHAYVMVDAPFETNHFVLQFQICGFENSHSYSSSLRESNVTITNKNSPNLKLNQ